MISCCSSILMNLTDTMYGYQVESVHLFAFSNE